MQSCHFHAPTCRNTFPMQVTHLRTYSARMDYRPALLDAVATAVAAGSIWNASAIAEAASAVRARAAAGPIYAGDAIAIVNALPGFWFEAQPQLAVTATATTAATPGPQGNALGPLTAEGKTSWYWCATQFTVPRPPAALDIPKGATGPGEVTMPIGALIMMQQVTINAARNISAWQLFMSATDPLTGGWVTVPTRFFDNSQVQVVPNGVLFASPRAEGVINLAQGGSTFSVEVVDHVTGFQFVVLASSERGPTYQQSTGNIDTIGRVAQTGYWSIVDGVITSPEAAGGLTGSIGGLTGPAGGLTGPTSSATSTSRPAAASPPGAMLCVRAGAPTFLYRPGQATGSAARYYPGWCWLDYQQEGLLPIKGIVKFLGAVTPAPSPVFPWMWVAIQLDGVQYALRFLGASAVQALVAGKTVSGKANVWVPNADAQYAVPATATVLASYPGTSIPRVVKVTIDASATSPSQTLVLDSYVRTAPQFTPTSGYESPSEVIGHPSGRAVVEWNADSGTPEYYAAIAGFPSPSTYAKKIAAADPYAVSVLVGSVFIIVAFIAVIVSASLYVKTCPALVPKASAARPSLSTKAALKGAQAGSK
jgi:hypothetical protein